MSLSTSRWFSRFVRGDDQPPLRAAQCKIFACDFRGQPYLRRASFGLRGARVCLCRLDASAHTAEHVDLPRRVEAEFVGVVTQRPDRPTAARAILARESGVRCHGRRIVELLLAKQRT